MLINETVGGKWLMMWSDAEEYIIELQALLAASDDVRVQKLTAELEQTRGEVERLRGIHLKLKAAEARAESLTEALREAREVIHANWCTTTYHVPPCIAVEAALSGVPAPGAARTYDDGIDDAAVEVRKWIDAYPEDIWSPPTTDQVTQAHKTLTGIGMSLDKFSANMGRHMGRCILTALETLKRNRRASDGK